MNDMEKYYLAIGMLIGVAFCFFVELVKAWRIYRKSKQPRGFPDMPEPREAPPKPEPKDYWHATVEANLKKMAKSTAPGVMPIQHFSYTETKTIMKTRKVKPRFVRKKRRRHV